MIFIGGIHGVGKTSFCQKIFDNYGVKCFSASQLIAAERKEEFGTDKRVDQIENNQSLLLSAINRLSNKNEFYLLDGHFCLMKKGGGIEKIPFETFELISPSGIVVLTNSITNIRNSLNTRDGISYDITELHTFQCEEVDYAKYVAEQLDVPFRIFDSSDSSKCYYEFISPIDTKKGEREK